MNIDLSDTELFAYADLAAGSEALHNRRAARQTVVVAARDWLERWFVLLAWAGRISAGAFRDKIIEAAEKYRPKKFGLEANGMQVLFGALVREKAKEKLTFQARFVPIYQPTRGIKKEYRIRTGLGPVIDDGRLFLLDKTSEIAQEIRGFPTAATVDLIDSLETIIRTAPKSSSVQSREEDVVAYAKYLRSTRCPPHLISEKIAQYRSQKHLN